MTAHLNKVDVNMKRCVAQKTQKLRFCRNFVRHEIDNSDLQGTNVLMSGSVIGNNEYILISNVWNAGRSFGILIGKVYPTF